MKRKALKLLSLCAVIIFLLTACGNSTTGKNTASSGRPTADSPNIEAEGIGKNIIPMFYLSRHFPPHDSATRFVSGKYRNKIIL